MLKRSFRSTDRKLKVFCADNNNGFFLNSATGSDNGKC